MLIKGALCEHLDESQRKKPGHDLVPLWGAFKSQVSDPKLDRFDRAIEELDKFEDIRYPDSIAAKGLLCEFSFDPTEPRVSDFSPKTPRYTLRIDELDALVEVIFQKASVNPRFFFNSLNVAARRYLDRYQAIRW